MMKKLLIVGLVALAAAGVARADGLPTDLCGAERYIYVYDPCDAGVQFGKSAALELWTSNLGQKWRRDNPGEVAFVRAYDAQPLSADDAPLALADVPGPRTLFGKALVDVIQAYKAARGTGPTLPPIL